MKSFKDLFSEVAQPNNPEEQKFKDQHTIQVFDHPVAEPEQFSGEIQGKSRVKRLSDYVADEDEKAYDKATAMEETDTDDEVLAENPQEEVPMMVRQLEFICYAAEEVMDYLHKTNDPAEWYQNKLSSAFDQMKTLHAYAEGSMRHAQRHNSQYNDSDDNDYYAASYGYGESVED